MVFPKAGLELRLLEIGLAPEICSAAGISFAPTADESTTAWGNPARSEAEKPGSLTSNATSLGAWGKDITQIAKKAATRPSAGLVRLVAVGRSTSRMRLRRCDVCSIRPATACAKAKPRLKKLFSATDTRHCAYACGFELPANTKSSQAISRSSDKPCPIHQNAG